MERRGTVDMLATSPRPDAASAGDEDALFAWVAEVCGGPVQRISQASGGNRCRSWAIDVAAPDGAAEVFLRYAPPRPPSAEPYTVHREAQVYRAIGGAGLLAPRLIAEHPRLQAVLTSRAPGIAEFRRLHDAAEKQAIACELMDTLARLHRIPTAGVTLDGGGQGVRIADHVRAELGIWQAMYAETGRTDPLLDVAFNWLAENMPDPDGAVVLAHGDAGPGNFLFEQGRMTALIDWELAHLGDPMEDLAWFSMRCVMEPVPDFSECLREYERRAGAPVDRARILYHRAFVSTRVVVIRHRNVTGEPAHAIVSRALNRRLLVEALSDAAGVPVDPPAPLDLPPTEQGGLFDHVLADLRDVVVARSTDRQVVAKAKEAAKVLKYLHATDRYGAALAEADDAALTALLGTDASPDALGAALAEGRIGFPQALDYFAGQAARQAQLAAAASGGIASRYYPAL